MNASIIAIAAAVAAAFLISAAWYAVWGRSLGRLHPAYADGASRSPGATMGVELVRNLVLALVTTWLLSRVDVSSVAGGLGTGIVLWLGFPVVILSGSVFHERVPVALAAIHAGDWLLKLLAVATIVSVWG